MCDSPQGKNSGSPEIFRNIRCNLDDKFISDDRDSIKSENLSVFARVRPLLPQEEAKGHKECIAAIDEHTVRVVVPTSSAKYKSSRQTEEIIEDYTFTTAFGPETGQFVFFQETMLNIMSNFVEGSNSMIFSYGITGSGKTYTLQGNSENPGIIPLSLKLFFAVTQKQLMTDILVKPHMYSDVVPLSTSEKEKELYTRERLLSLYDEECEAAPGSFRNNNNASFAMTLCNLFSDDFEAEQRQTTLCAEDMASAQAATLMKEVIKKSVANQPGVCYIWVSFIEIYNETIFDLLQPISNHRSKLNLGEDKNGNVYVKGATEVCIFNSEEALKILNIGRKHLSIASTKMNYQSSRSHCIYTIRVVRVPDVNNISHARVNRLSFCDLAGSERVSKAQTTGMRLKEASAINTSLLVLGRCLEHLRLSQMGRDKRLIPFRESKLTRLFSGFFMGQGKATMIANASPSDYTFDETLHVLKFSAVAKKIMVNDTFLSNASTTIQSICNQWEMHKANISTYNESMESVDSDNDLIQEKDALIENLLSLAENFAKKEKEMRDMEMRIRREVCQEYAEIREELLDMQKLRYEEEMAAIKEVYEKRIANLDQRYENIIKGFKDQLSESDESFLNDQSLDASKSFEVLNDSARSSLSKPDSSHLKKELEEKTGELEIVRKELESKQSELINFKRKYEELTLKMMEIESGKEDLKKELASEAEKNQVLKGNTETLQKEIEQVKSQKASDEEAIKTYKTEIDKLMKRIEITGKEYEASKKQLESTLDERLQKETTQYTDKISVLEKEMTALKAAKNSYQKDIQNLQEKLSESQVENGKSEKIIHDQCETISALESETEILRKEIENLEKKIAELKESKEVSEMELEKEKAKHKKEIQDAKSAVSEFSNLKLQYQSDLNEKNENIASLKQDINRTNKNFETLQKELKIKETVSKELEKEIDTLKQSIDKMQKEMKESVSSKVEIEKKATKLTDELKASHENSLQLSSKLKELENKNAACELEIQKLLKNKENLTDASKVTALEKELSQVQNELKTLREVNKRTEELKEKELEESKQKIKIVEEKYQTLEDNCRKLKESNESLLLQKTNLEKDLHSTKDSMESLHQSNLETLKTKEKEYEILNQKYDQDLQKWKQEKLTIDSELKELKEKLSTATDKINSLEKSILEKSSKISELQSSIKKYDVNNDKLKQDELLADTQKKQLEEKLNLATNKMKLMEQDILEKTSKISELDNQVKAYKVEIENLKNECESLEADNLELKSKIDSYKDEIKEVEKKLISAEKNFQSVQEASRKSTEIEKEICDYKQEVKQLKSSLQSTEKEKSGLLTAMEKLKENLLLAEKDKSDYLSTLKELNEKLKLAGKDKTDLLATIKQLKENEHLVGKEKNDLLASVKELKESLQLAGKEKNDLLTTVKKIKDNLQLVEKEKTDLQVIISEKTKNISDIETELFSTKDHVESLKKQLGGQNPQFEDLKNELASSNAQLQEKITELEANKVILKEKESEFNVVKKELEELKCNHERITKEKDKLLDNVDTEIQNVNQLKKELKEKQTELESIGKELQKSESDFNALKTKNEKLSLKIKEIESEKKNLENKITETENIYEEKIKELKSSFEEKMLMEKEQHTVEIEQTMKFKREVERENKGLKEENAKFKEHTILLEKKLESHGQSQSLEKDKKETLSKIPTKPVTKMASRTDLTKESKKTETGTRGRMTKASSKSDVKEIGKSLKAANKNETKDTKEDSPKISTTRSLRHKEIKPQDISFSSVDSHEPETPDVSKKNRKRMSDEDFDPAKERATKKMKPSEESSKIPLQKRTSKRKLTNDQTENLSPVQKIANSISTRFKAVAENVTSKISSPRLTRGRKKLYNPDTAASSKTEKVTRGKK